jgi:hypothetical protein
MIKHEILQPEGILIVEPLSALAAEDFQALTSEVNEYLAGHPDLRGILIHARAFPGCGERVKNCDLRLLQVGQAKYCFGLGAFRYLPTCHTGGLPRRSQYRRSVGGLMFSKPVSGLRGLVVHSRAHYV